jgi:hypothetical protein
MVVRPGRVADADDPTQGLPKALSTALAAFSRHLAAERALSRHTVRAYNGDVQSLLMYAWWSGIEDPGRHPDGRGRRNQVLRPSITQPCGAEAVAGASDGGYQVELFVGQHGAVGVPRFGAE